MRRLYIIIVLLLVLVSCGKNYSPRPYGYFRIDLPENTYTTFDNSYPYTFQMSENATIIPRKETFWMDIYYPAFKARLHCSYKTVTGNFHELSEDSRSLVYKHAIRADAITERPFENPQAKVYGILYDIAGNSASPLQVVLTDSTRHFFRAALYFNAVPNSDSIAPVVAYFREELRQMVETFEWKK
jgi:gliding motility-associated lipoprotein GldD